MGKRHCYKVFFKKNILIIGKKYSMLLDKD